MDVSAHRHDRADLSLSADATRHHNQQQQQQQGSAAELRTYHALGLQESAALRTGPITPLNWHSQRQQANLDDPGLRHHPWHDDHQQQQQQQQQLHEAQMRSSGATEAEGVLLTAVTADSSPSDAVQAMNNLQAPFTAGELHARTMQAHPLDMHEAWHQLEAHMTSSAACGLMEPDILLTTAATAGSSQYEVLQPQYSSHDLNTEPSDFLYQRQRHHHLDIASHQQPFLQQDMRPEQPPLQHLDRHSQRQQQLLDSFSAPQQQQPSGMWPEQSGVPSWHEQSEAPSQQEQPGGLFQHEHQQWQNDEFQQQGVQEHSKVGLQSACMQHNFFASLGLWPATG